MAKPNGKWECRLCKSIWEGSQLYEEARFTSTTWTCHDLTCGGICHPVREIQQPDTALKHETAKNKAISFKKTSH